MPLSPTNEALVRKHSFQVKFDRQLEVMLAGHTAKLNKLRESGGDLDQYTQDADGMVAARWELKQANPDLSSNELAQEFLDRRTYYLQKEVILQEIVDILPVEIDARARGIVTRTPVGTKFFLDGDAGNNANDGLTVGNPFLDIDKFTENARSAGDICVVRRGTTIDDGTDVNFTSDGTKADPIVITADNANEFGDDVDLSVTATATLTFGSKTITFSADISGVLSTGDVIYAASDDADEFAYEVDMVVTTIVTLFLPYKGAQEGSGKTMTNMQGNPVWSIVSANFQWVFNGDNWWKVQGIHLRGTDVAGQVGIDSCVSHVFKDMIFEGNGVADQGIECIDDAAFIYLSKCRFFNYSQGINSTTAGAITAEVVDCLFDGNSVANGTATSAGRWDQGKFIDTEFKNHADQDVTLNIATSTFLYRFRNCIFGSTKEFNSNAVGLGGSFGLSEDHNGVLGVSKQFISASDSVDDIPLIQSDTGTVRSGGGVISGKVTPSIHLSNKSELSRQVLFEIPFYATTVSKKYEVFFRSTATSDWTTNPTVLELWIELEYWGHPSNNFRRITKSIGIIDMNGSTTFTALDVTVAPSQTGVVYLRGYYAKTKESGKANTFFWDVVPVVT